MKKYITYKGIEGKLLEDGSVKCIIMQGMQIFKSVKSFKKSVSQYVYKYIDNKNNCKKVTYTNFSNIPLEYISINCPNY